MKASKIKGGRGKGLGIIDVVANLIIFSGGGGGEPSKVLITC